MKSYIGLYLLPKTNLIVRYFVNRTLLTCKFTLVSTSQ